MKTIAICGLFLIALCATAAAQNAAQESGVTASCHPWGRFEPGAWKKVRVVSETLDDQGKVVSSTSTDTNTTLLDIDNCCVTLRIEACVDVVGKRFERESQTLKQTFHGELLGPDLKISDPIDDEVIIQDRAIPCKVQRFESSVSGGKNATSVHFSPDVAPYILKRVGVTTDAEGKQILAETLFEVTSLQAPVNVRGKVQNGVIVKTVHKNTNGAITTYADVLVEVPGGVVASRSEEVDKSGRLVRRSTLELADYGSEPEEDRNILGRKRSNRRTKQPTHYGP